MASYFWLRFFRRASAPAMAFILAGCGDGDFSDLNAYVAEVKSRPKGLIEPLPEVRMIEPYIFKPEGLRDPFKALEAPEQAEAVETAKADGTKPDLSRRREELEAFPLDGLQMVGTLRQASTLWALIKAGDGTVHRVRTGHYLGKNHGKIIRILADKIELIEIVPDKPGTWREQQASLVLSE